MSRSGRFQPMSRALFTDAPEEKWFDELLARLNESLRDLSDVIDGRISLENQRGAKIELEKVPAGEPVLVETGKLSGAPQEVRVIWSELDHYGLKWNIVAPGTIELTILAPTNDPRDLTIWIQT